MKNCLSGQLSTRSTQGIYLLTLCDPVPLCQDILGGRNTLSEIDPEGFFAPVLGARPPGMLPLR